MSNTGGLVKYSDEMLVGFVVAVEHVCVLFAQTLREEADGLVADSSGVNFEDGCQVGGCSTRECFVCDVGFGKVDVTLDRGNPHVFREFEHGLAVDAFEQVAGGVRCD